MREDSRRRGFLVAMAALALVSVVVTAAALGIVRFGGDAQLPPVNSADPGDDELLATVNDQPIFQSDIQLMEDFATGRSALSDYGYTEGTMSVEDAHPLVLAMVITRTVMFQAAQAQGLTVTEQELDAAIDADDDQIRADVVLQAETERKMQEYGWTVEEERSRRRNGLRESMLFRQLQDGFRSEAGQLSSEEIEDYIETNNLKDGLITLVPMRFDDYESAQAAYDDLSPLNAAQHPITFTTTFVEYGIAAGVVDPAAGPVESYTYDEVEELPDYVEAAVLEDVTEMGLVEIADGTVLFLVLNKTWAQPFDVYSTAEQVLVERMMDEYVVERVEQLIADAEIVIHD